MGQCISVGPSGVPVCQQCSKEGGAEWHDLPVHQKQQWVYKDGRFTCKACSMKGRIEKIKYEKERQYYAKAKDELYPKQPLKERLKRVKSNEAWEGTPSFYQSWRPASNVAELVRAALGSRKGTGMVGKPGGGSSAGSSEHGSDAAAAAAAAGSIAGSREQLAQLGEEVEEEDLASDSSGSVHGGAAGLPAAGEEEAGPSRAAPSPR